MIFHLVIILNIKMNLFYKPCTIQPLKNRIFTTLIIFIIYKIFEINFTKTLAFLI